MPQTKLQLGEENENKRGKCTTRMHAWLKAHCEYIIEDLFTSHTRCSDVV